jgi:hypothetical protein
MKPFLLRAFRSFSFERANSKKINQCRTTKVNSVFTYIAHLVRDMAEIKMGDSKLLFEIPHLVVPPGIEPGTQGFSVLCSTD